MKEWFAVFIGETLTSSALCDGWFCDEELVKKLYEERITQYKSINVFMVKLIASKKPVA